MKTLLLTAALLTALCPAGFAQSQQLSLRGGLVLTQRNNNPDYSIFNVEKQATTHWSGELGYGLQRRSGLRYDLALQYFSDELRAATKPGVADYGADLHVRTAIFGLRFGAGYDLMRLFGRERRFRLVAGLTATPTLFRERVEHNYDDFVGHYHEDRFVNHRLALFGGLALNPEWRLAGRWWLSGHLGLEQRLAPADFDFGMVLRTGIRSTTSFSLGIARRL